MNYGVVEYWTQPEVEILVKMCADNKPLKEIAHAIGRSKSAVNGKARALKLRGKNIPYRSYQRKKMLFTASELRELYQYEPETGHFFRLKEFTSTLRENQVSGSIINSGYRIISVKSWPYLAHRLAWLYMTGEWPKNQIDHINGIRTDNRWCNLREATHSQNAQNSRVRSHNKLGLKGVVRHGPNSFAARIRKDGKLYKLGVFHTPHEASAAYREASQRLHGDFGRGE